MVHLDRDVYETVVELRILINLTPDQHGYCVHVMECDPDIAVVLSWCLIIDVDYCVSTF